MDNLSVSSGTQGAHRNRAMVRETSTSPASHSEAIFASRRFSLQQQRASEKSTDDISTPYILPLLGNQMRQTKFPVGSKVYVLDSLTCATVQQCFIQMIPTVKLLYEVKTDNDDIQMLSQDSLRYVDQGNSEDSRTDVAVAGLSASRTAHQPIVHKATSRPSGKSFPSLLKVSSKTITALNKKYSEKIKKLSRQKKFISKLRGEAEYTRNIAKNLSESLECSICFSTMRNPYILPTCSHRFCGKCIKKSIRTNGKKCPMCREYACLKTIREDQFLREIISNALVKPTNVYRAAAKDTMSSGGNDAV